MTEFGGHDVANITLLSPIALSMTIAAAILMLTLPRKYALIPMLIITCYITLGQRLVIGGLDFTMMRLLIIVGWVRIYIKGENYPFQWNLLDSLMIAWMVVKTVAFTLLWLTFGAFVQRLGNALDVLGLYFLCRYIITDIDDIKTILYSIPFMLAPLAVFMFIENGSGRNFFSMFGGVPEMTSVRYDKIRAQGPFRHAILAGTMGAIFFPIFYAMFYQKGKWVFASILGMISCLIIVYSCSSSGPLLALLSTFGGLAFWLFRDYTRHTRWVILGVLFVLNFVMKAPIWFLFARVADLTGGTGWHRAYLIDRAVANFWGWAFVGTRSTANWGYYLFDVTSGYLTEGVDGGFITMLLFIGVISVAFKFVGMTVKALEKFDFPLRILIWSLGVSMLAHTTSLLSVSYFDQSNAFWVLQLGLIAPLASLVYIKVEYPKATKTIKDQVAEQNGSDEVEEESGKIETPDPVYQIVKPDVGTFTQ